MRYTMTSVLRKSRWRKNMRCFSTHATYKAVATSNPRVALPPVHVYNASDKLLCYTRGWAWQQYLLSTRLAARRSMPSIAETDTDCVLLFEHQPVYTLGRGANENYLTFLRDQPESQRKLSRKERGEARLAMDRTISVNDLLSRSEEEAVNRLSSIAKPVIAPNGAPVYRVERGGEVTCHAPGQLVVYPMLDLQREPFQKDLHWFLRHIEQVIILVLQNYDIHGVRDEINTGVWVDHKKIAAVGVSSSRWITTHGFALNICPDLSYFDTSIIIPCGIDSRGVTSLHKLLIEKHGTAAQLPSVPEVAVQVLEKISAVFDIEIQQSRDIS